MIVRSVCCLQYAKSQEIRSVSSYHETEKDDEVIGEGDAEAQLYRQGQQNIEDVQGVKMEAMAGWVVKVGGEIRAIMEIEDRRFDPPQVPVVAPAVEAISRNSRVE